MTLMLHTRDSLAPGRSGNVCTLSMDRYALCTKTPRGAVIEVQGENLYLKGPPPASKVHFKAMENGVSDVFVEPPECGDHLPIPNLHALIESYLQGMAQLYLHLSCRTPDHEWFGHNSQLQPARLGQVEVVDVAVDDSHPLDTSGHGNDRHTAVFVSVVRLVEEPEGVLIENLPSWIWGQRADVALSGWGHGRYPTIGNSDGSVRDWERDAFILLRTHGGSVLGGEKKGQIVQAVPKVLQRIPNNEGNVVGERLQHLCNHFGSAFTIGLGKDSITIAFPGSESTIDFVDVRLGVGKLSTVAQ